MISQPQIIHRGHVFVILYSLDLLCSFLAGGKCSAIPWPALQRGSLGLGSPKKLLC
jgi:hypothetical protein